MGWVPDVRVDDKVDAAPMDDVRDGGDGVGRISSSRTPVCRNFTYREVMRGGTRSLVYIERKYLGN